jgi:hypothetical protein
MVSEKHVQTTRTASAIGCEEKGPQRDSVGFEDMLKAGGPGAWMCYLHEIQPQENAVQVRKVGYGSITYIYT